MSNQMSDKKYEAKLRKIIDEGKPKAVTHNGKKFIFQKRKLMKLEKKKKKMELFLF